MRVRGAFLVCLVVLYGALAASASAGTIAVTNQNDSGPGSLRDAIAKAVVNETITVPAGEITLTSGPLTISKNLTITGAGPASTVISGNDTYRVFTITGAPTVTIDGLTITHGKNSNGAGINATGEVTLEDVNVSGNHAGGEGSDGSGGGIEFGAGTFKLIESTVIANTAGGGHRGAGFGGGIEYESTADAQSFSLSLLRSTVADNHAGGGGLEASGFGAGIDASSGNEKGSISISLAGSVLSGNVAGGGGAESSGFGGGLSLSSGGNKNTLSLALERSAVASNVAGGGEAENDGFGGGIEFDSGGTEVVQTLTASNTTIYGNTAGGGGAPGFGGGLEFGSGAATLSYLTVTGNSAGGGGGAAHGGGLEVTLSSGGLGDSIVAANAGGNCATAVPSTGHNIDDGSTCGLKAPGDKSATSPGLGPIGEHGGSSSTEMPLAGSPAINNGDPAACPATDQRGVTRPQGGACDIGAVEVAPPLVTTGLVSNVAAESAIVDGTVTPSFSATKYHFDFGTTTAYGSVTPEGSAGESGTGQPISALLSGLKPQTTYHFRVVAMNAAGSTVGTDETLTTGTVPIVTSSPSLSSASLTNKRFRVGKNSTAVVAKRAPVGTSFRFKLTAQATVRIVIIHFAKGLRRGRSCVAPSAKLRRSHAKSCVRTLTVGTLRRLNLRAGNQAIVFSGRIGSHALRPGLYKASLSASNAAGRSKQATLSFTVVR